jgi:Ca2+/Na+ antiporter
MLYLATFLWGWLLGAFVLGLGMGWIAVVRRGKIVSRVLAQRLSVLVAALIAIALAKLVPGRFGYWLDLGLAMFAFYLVGCAIGSWLRDWVVSRHVPIDGPTV